MTGATDGGGGKARAPLGAIFGTGRSGSTWLGAIINSHPDVAYRFEPLHRLADHPRVGRAREILLSETAEASQLEEVYAALLPAHPQLDKPPFFRKRWGRGVGQTLFWQACSHVRPLQPVFERLYTPPGRPLVVFKEVGFARALERLVRVARLRTVYLVRHPCAVVSSSLKGQGQGLMPTGRLGVVQSLVETHDPALAARFAGRYDSLTNTQRNALLWRIDVERALAAIQGQENGMLVVYESLCRDPAAVSEAALTYFGLGPSEQTARFLEMSVTKDQGARWRSGEGLVNKYFSVFRDPLESMNKWKTALSAADQAEVFDIVSESAAFQSCAAIGNW